MAIAAVLLLPSRILAQTGPSQCIWGGYDWDAQRYGWACGGEFSGLTITKDADPDEEGRPRFWIKAKAPDLSEMLKLVDDLQQSVEALRGQLTLQQQINQQQGAAIADLEKRLAELEPGTPPADLALRVVPEAGGDDVRAAMEALGWQYRHAGSCGPDTPERALARARLGKDQVIGVTRDGWDLEWTMDGCDWRPAMRYPAADGERLGAPVDPEQRAAVNEGERVLAFTR